MLNKELQFYIFQLLKNLCFIFFCLLRCRLLKFMKILAPIYVQLLTDILKLIDNWTNKKNTTEL